MGQRRSAGAAWGIGTQLTQPILNDQEADSNVDGVMEWAAMEGRHNFDCFFGKDLSRNTRKWLDTTSGSQRVSSLRQNPILARVQAMDVFLTLHQAYNGRSRNRGGIGLDTSVEKVIVILSLLKECVNKCRWSAYLDRKVKKELILNLIFGVRWTPFDTKQIDANCGSRRGAILRQYP